MEQPFFFEIQGEHEGARLFAITHRPAEACGDVGLVFCHPYGEEKQFSYRVGVRFARRAAEAGFPVLRFDCRGYGDSEGDIGECTLDTHVQDTLTACSVARERLGVERLVLVGLRFGATVATLAAERAAGTAGLVLWSPIVSGARYVGGLLRKKLFADVVSGRAGGSRERIVEELNGRGHVEIEGNYLTLRMYEDLSALDLTARASGFDRPVLVSTVRNASGRHTAYEKLVAAFERGGAETQLKIAEDQEYWDDRCMFERVFPEELYGETLDWAAARWPRAVRA